MTYGFSYAPYNDLQAFKDACTENTIAIMVEPVQGEGGDVYKRQTDDSVIQVVQQFI